MTAFATPDDLASRWRTLTTDEKNQASTLLEDAAVWLRAWFPGLDSRVSSGALDVAIPRMVSCSMVKRAMLASGNEGVSNAQTTQTYGPFSTQVGNTFKNPEGNLYITSDERDLLDGQPSGAVSMECAGM